ncbi:MAG: S8 family serine peptidase, partial [Thermoplasmata archaeon]|nr:S8 family serine peptidase [Thermoplasmata archaeon]
MGWYLSRFRGGLKRGGQAMLNIGKKWIGVFLVGALLTSFLAALVTAPVTADDSPDVMDLETPEENLAGDVQAFEYEQGGEQKSVIAWEQLVEKIDPTLRDVMSSSPDEMVNVIVPTTDVASLAKVVQKYDYKGLLGTKAKPSENIVPITLEVPANSLLEIASLDGVMAVYLHDIPTVDMVSKSEWAAHELPEEEETPWTVEAAKGFFDEEIGGIVTPIVHGEEVPPETKDFGGGVVFNEAPKAWADGYTGSGVMVALHDTGVDFAHPDLQGTQAIFNVSWIDPAVLAQKPYLAAYDGWPIAFDALSMEDFLASGGDLTDPGLVGYVDTSTVSAMISLPGGDFVDYTRDSPVPSYLEYVDQPIFDDGLGFDFPDIFVLQDTYQLNFSVPVGVVLMMIEVDWPADPDDDLDAALFYDSNGDHIPTLDELVSYAESSTGNHPEQVADVRMPGTANDYMLRILGYTTNNPTLAVVNITFVSLVEITASYNVTGITSMSDQYHLGLLQDPSLTSAYFVPPAVLLVDSTTPGFYDTYYADLDFDFEFNDEKAAVKGDEISFVDVDGDGYADISGGMVYYISNAASVTDEAVITATGGETYATLAQGNISVPERITVMLGGTPWRTTMVTSEAMLGQLDDTVVGLQSGNIVEGSIVLDGADVVADNETSFTSQTGSEAGFSLAHGGVDTASVQIYRLRTSEDWYAETWVLLASGPDYTVAPDGTVTFDVALVSGSDPFKKNLPDDEFHAFYSYSEIMTMDEDYTADYETGNITFTYPWGTSTAITADYEYYNWILDYAEGNLTFTNPLGAGDVITADYQYGVTPIPYSDVYSERKGIDNYYPGSGDMVALMVGYSGDHGTMTAGEIVSAGNIMYGRTTGVAPDTKIIPVLTGAGTAILDVFDSWYFAVEGYDGLPNSGDDAQISSNSWGTSGVSGFHFYDRFSDWLSTDYSQGSTIFTVSSGNSGPGYGSVGPPNAPSLMMVSGAQQFFYRVMPEYLELSYDGGPNPGGMETWYGGSIGPTMSGSFGVDIMAEASFVYACIPINNIGPDFNGFTATDIVSGTSFAAPTTSGILALAYDAYKQANGVFPDVYTVKAIAMSGATDIDNDPFVQGAGYVNAWNTARIAGGTGGAYATPYNWIPGDWRGTEYDAFPKLLEAGESDAETFTLTNPSAAPLTYDVSTDVLEKVGEAEYSYNPSDLIQPLASSDGVGSLFYILNGTGIYDMYDHSLVQAIDPNLWNNADLLRITSAMSSSDNYGSQYLEIHRFTDGIANDQWRGHSGAVRAVDISPDGTMMASIGEDGKLFVTDTATSQITWEFTYGAGVVTSGSHNTFDVKFTPDSAWVLATFGNTTISVWDVSTGSLLFDLASGAFPDLNIFSLDVSPNGTWVVGGTDIDPVPGIAYVYVWDLTNPPNPIGMYMGMTEGPANDVAFSPNGTWVAASDYWWWTINVFDVTTLTPIVEFDTDPLLFLGYPMALEFSPDGTKIAYTWKYGFYLRALGFPGGLPGVGFPDVGIYDVTIGDYVGWMAGHNDAVMDLSWSPDGTKLATSSGFRPDIAGGDNTVRIWDATQDNTLLETVVKYFDFVYQVDFAPDGISFASASADGAALIVDTTDTPVLEYTVTTALVDTFSRGLWFERNRLVTSFFYNVELVRLHDPATRNPDGIIIWARSIGAAPDTTRRIAIEYYQKAPWTWLNVAPSTVNAPAGGTVTFDATMTVPGTAGVGLYEGYIRASEATYGDVLIPVMVNVPATSAVFSFGGDTSSFNLYDNNKLLQDIDTRYYYMDVPDTFVLSEGMKLMVDVDISQSFSEHDARHFDLGELSVPGNFPGDAPQFPESRYGPYVLEETDVGAPGVFGKNPDWTGAGQGFIKGFSAEAGLNMIAIYPSNQRAQDSMFYEDISGETGIMSFTPYPLDFYTNQLQGSTPLTLTTNIPWLPNPDPFEESYGKSVAITVAGSEVFEFTDIPIADDGEQTGDESFIEYLARTQNTMLWDVDPSIISIEFHLMGHTDCCPDMDLGLFLDANNDGLIQVDEFVTYDADADADETVSLLLPTPGTYIIAMAGFDVWPSGSLADLTISELAAGPSPFEVTGVPNTIPGDSGQVVNLEWNLPEETPEGPVKAAFFVSPGNAPLAMVLLVPVTLTVDMTPPEVLQTLPADGAVTSDSTPAILAGFSDDNGAMDSTTISLWLDGV